MKSQTTSTASGLLLKQLFNDLFKKALFNYFTILSSDYILSNGPFIIPYSVTKLKIVSMFKSFNKYLSSGSMEKSLKKKTPNKSDIIKILNF